jgi:hypothetical protein
VLVTNMNGSTLLSSYDYRDVPGDGNGGPGVPGLPNGNRPKETDTTLNTAGTGYDTASFTWTYDNLNRLTVEQYAATTTAARLSNESDAT